MTSASFSPGYEFRSAPRPMTRERMRWYVDIQETVQADTGRIVTQPPTIHDDDAYAKKNGLPGIIADVKAAPGTRLRFSTRNGDFTVEPAAVRAGAPAPGFTFYYFLRFISLDANSLPRKRA